MHETQADRQAGKDRQQADRQKDKRADVEKDAHY
jgi:hypothetical protein